MNDLALLLDLSQRLADLPERLADVLRRRDRGQGRRPAQEGHGESEGAQTSAPTTSGVGSLKPRDRYGATTRLLSAVGSFGIPGFGELAQLMRQARELGDAWKGFREAWWQHSQREHYHHHPFLRDLPRSRARGGPIGPHRPTVLHPRVKPYVEPPEQLPHRSRPVVVDPQGQPFVPTRQLPRPTRPQLLPPARPQLPAPKPLPPATRPLPTARKRRPRKRPVLTPLHPLTPPRWMPAKFTPPRRSTVDLNDPRAFEIDLERQAPVLPGRLPPLTSAAARGGAAPAGERDTQTKLDQLVKIGEKIAQALEEQQADADGGTPSDADREQGGRRSMWEPGREYEEPEMPSRRETPRQPVRMPGRPARKPEGKGGKLLLEILEGLL